MIKLLFMLSVSPTEELEMWPSILLMHYPWKWASFDYNNSLFVAWETKTGVKKSQTDQLLLRKLKDKAADVLYFCYWQ